jgi:ABC-type multidrug transport system permease subunit
MTNVFHGALFIAIRDAARLLRGPATIVWTFVMPVVFIYFIGTVTSGFRPAATQDSIGVLVPADAGFLAEPLLERLRLRGYNVVRVQSGDQLQRFRRRLEIPAGFTTSVLAGQAAKIRFNRTGDDLAADYDQVRLSRAIYTVLADLILASSSQEGVTAPSMAAAAAIPRTLTLDSRPAGKRQWAPAGFDQSVPGTMVQFTLLVLFTSGAVTLTLERNQGILRRLASAPMSRGAVVLGKWGARMALGVIQITFAMLAGTLLFGFRWGPNLPAVVLVLIAYAALSASAGMLLGNFGRNEGQVIAVGVTAGNVLAGLGGCWWPIEVAPLWAQKLALLLPTGWAMDAMHKLVSFGDSPAAVLPHVAALAATALIAGYVLARTFRFE